MAGVVLAAMGRFLCFLALLSVLVTVALEVVRLATSGTESRPHGPLWWAGIAALAAVGAGVFLLGRKVRDACDTRKG
jgi:hypothetical protein